MWSDYKNEPEVKARVEEILARRNHSASTTAAGNTAITATATTTTFAGNAKSTSTVATAVKSPTEVFNALLKPFSTVYSAHNIIFMDLI